jgi:tetratricopeptide (TPR) repeat protein
MSNGGSNADDVHFKYGLKLMKSGKYDDAILEFNQVKEDKNYVFKANANRGICLFNLQREAEARKIFEDLNIAEYFDPYYRGLVHFYLNEYLLSLYYFAIVPALDPDRKFLLFRTGLTYLELLEQIKRFKEEVLLGKEGLYPDKWLDELQKLESIYKQTLYADLKNKNISNFTESLEFIEEFKSDLTFLKENKANNGIIPFCEKWISRTSLCEIKFLSDGISKEWDFSEFSYNKGVALSNIEKYREAIEAFDAAIGKPNSYALAVNNKGNTYVKMEQFKDAIEAYTEAISINPKYSIAYNNRGQVYFNLKNYKKALEDFDRAIESNTSNYNSWTNKGAVFFHQKEYGKAKKAFEKALELNPDYALANIYLAKILLYLGSSVLSYDRINKTIDFDVRNADAWKLKGQLLLKDKRYEEAVVSFNHTFQYSKGDLSLVLWKAYARYLEVLDQEYPSFSRDNQDEEPGVLWSHETKPIDERVVDVSKKVINSLPLKPNDSQSSDSDESSDESPDEKAGKGSRFKSEYYSIIRELEMYSCISCKRKDVSCHIILDTAADFLSWGKKNVKLFFLPIVRYLLVKSNSFSVAGISLQSINSDLEKYELDNVKSYVLFLLGCLYYKVGDYFEAKNKLEECIKQGPNDIKKSAAQLLDHISTTYIRSPWWTWWLSSPTYRWTKRIIFIFYSLMFIVLLLFHPFIYPALLEFIYLNQFTAFLIEASISPDFFAESSSTSVNFLLYYVLVSIPIFILFSPHISKFVVRAAPVEMEMKSPKDFEFILHPCLMDDIVRKIDDVPD